MTGIRQTFATLALTLTAVFVWTTGPVAIADDRWVEGQHYQTLTPPVAVGRSSDCLLYTSPSPRDATLSRMPSSA